MKNITAVAVIGVVLTPAAVFCFWNPEPKKRDFVAVVEQTSVTKFKDFTLFRTDLKYVQAMCGLTGGVDDEGNVRTEPPPCCYDTARKEMWVAFYHEACIVHELCHVEGRLDCARVGL